MTKTLQDALLRIYRIEGDPTDDDPLPLSITSPIAVAVKKVWPFYPPASQVVSSTPCFVNTTSPGVIEYQPGARSVSWSIHARLVCYDANSDQASKIASAFVDPIIERFGSQIKLSGLEEWYLNTIRFNGEQPVVFQDLSEAAGKTLIGLDFFIDLTHKFAATNAAGPPPTWA